MFLPLLLLTLAQSPEYTRAGNPQDIVTWPKPGYLLMGGGKDVEEAFQWMIEKSNAGDLLILRASGTAAYNPFVQKLGKVNSVATLILKTREQSSDPTVIDHINKAEAIFMAGGDQWNFTLKNIEVQTAEPNQLFKLKTWSSTSATTTKRDIENGRIIASQ